MWDRKQFGVCGGEFVGLKLGWIEFETLDENFNWSFVYLNITSIKFIS